MLPEQQQSPEDCKPQNAQAQEAVEVCPKEVSSATSFVRDECVSTKHVLGPGVGLRLAHHGVHHGGDHTDAGHLMVGGAVGLCRVLTVLSYLHTIWLNIPNYLMDSDLAIS